jgi:hypothetical protein
MDKDTQRLIELTVDFQHNPSDDAVVQIIDILRKRRDILQIARWLSKLKDTTRLPAHFLFDIHRRFPIANVILNGGSDFLYPLWRNFDTSASGLNLDPVTLSRNFVIPFANGACSLVYLNRIAETFDLDASENLFKESRRILNPKGAILLASSDRASSVPQAWFQENGFNIVSSDSEKISRRFNYVPRISDAVKNDKLFLAVKVTEDAHH